MGLPTSRVRTRTTTGSPAQGSVRSGSTDSMSRACGVVGAIEGATAGGAGANSVELDGSVRDVADAELLAAPRARISKKTATRAIAIAPTVRHPRVPMSVFG